MSSQTKKAWTCTLEFVYTNSGVTLCMRIVIVSCTILSKCSSVIMFGIIPHVMLIHYLPKLTLKIHMRE